LGDRLKKYDVVVVGAGPAGSLLGYLLARRGVDVLILERKELPRYKACGGGLTRRAFDLLPFDIDEVVEDRTFRTEIRVDGAVVFSKQTPEPSILMVMRDNFDFFITTKAVDAGAVLRDQTTFVSLDGVPGDVRVITDQGEFRSRIIAAADGVNSRVAKQLGLIIRRKAMVGMEGEVYCSNSSKLEQFKESAHFDFGIMPDGYGWLFPKSDHLSLGVVATGRSRAEIGKYFWLYLERKGLGRIPEVKPLRGHLIPYSPNSRNVFADDRGLVVGDAAGFSDPITGEGMFFCIREAQIADDIITKALDAGPAYLRRYSDAVTREFLQDQDRAKKMAYLLYRLPAISHSMLRRYGETAGESHLNVITGRSTYTELYNKLTDVRNILSALVRTIAHRDMPNV
jgi:geranylgeranyl reductase family protein